MSPRLYSFIVQLLRSSPRGEKLSQESLQIVVPVIEKQFESYYSSGANVLLNAHDHVWRDDNHGKYPSKYGRERQEIRLEVCNFLFNLCTKAIYAEMEKSR